MTEIAGFESFTDSSTLHRKEIIEELSRWQLNDGLFNPSWIKALRRYRKRSEEMKNDMDLLYEDVRVLGNTPIQRHGQGGIWAHRRSVTGIRKTYDGYRVELTESSSTNPNLLVEGDYR